MSPLVLKSGHFTAAPSSRVSTLVVHWRIYFPSFPEHECEFSRVFSIEAIVLWRVREAARVAGVTPELSQSVGRC